MNKIYQNRDRSLPIHLHPAKSFLPGRIIAAEGRHFLPISPL